MKELSKEDEVLFAALHAILLEIGPVNVASMTAAFCDQLVEEHDCPTKGGCRLVKILSSLGAELRSVADKHTAMSRVEESH